MSSNEKNGGTAAKKSFFQLIKFGLVGIGNTLIDMVVSTVLSIVLAIPFTGGWCIACFAWSYLAVYQCFAY